MGKRGVVTTSLLERRVIERSEGCGYLISNGRKSLESSRFELEFPEEPPIFARSGFQFLYIV